MTTYRKDFRSLSLEDMTQVERARIDMELYISDEYKSVHGRRPRHLNFITMTDVELASVYNQVVDDLKEQMDSDKEDRIALMAARKHPQGHVWLSAYGKICLEYDGSVDPDNIECWEWRILTTPPPVTLAIVHPRGNGLS